MINDKASIDQPGEPLSQPLGEPRGSASQFQSTGDAPGFPGRGQSKQASASQHRNDASRAKTSYFQPSPWVGLGRQPSASELMAEILKHNGDNAVPRMRGITAMLRNARQQRKQREARQPAAQQRPRGFANLFQSLGETLAPPNNGQPEQASAVEANHSNLSASPSLSLTTASLSKPPSALPATSNPSASPSFFPTTTSPSKPLAAKPTSSNPSASPSLSQTTASPSKPLAAKPTASNPLACPSLSPLTVSLSKPPAAKTTSSNPSASPSLSLVTASTSKPPSALPTTSNPSASPLLSPTTASLSKPTSAKPNTSNPSACPSLPPSRAVNDAGSQTSNRKGQYTVKRKPPPAAASRLVGVTKKDGKYRARYCKGGKIYSVGTYREEAQARMARQRVREAIHPRPGMNKEKIKEAIKKVAREVEGAVERGGAGSITQKGGNWRARCHEGGRTYYVGTYREKAQAEVAQQRAHKALRSHPEMEEEKKKELIKKVVREVEGKVERGSAGGTTGSITRRGVNWRARCHEGGRTYYVGTYSKKAQAVVAQQSVRKMLRSHPKMDEDKIKELIKNVARKVEGAVIAAERGVK